MWHTSRRLSLIIFVAELQLSLWRDDVYLCGGATGISVTGRQLSSWRGDNHFRGGITCPRGGSTIFLVRGFYLDDGATFISVAGWHLYLWQSGN